MLYCLSVLLEHGPTYIKQAYFQSAQVPLFNLHMTSYFVSHTATNGLPAGDIKSINKAAEEASHASGSTKYLVAHPLLMYNFTLQTISLRHALARRDYI